MTESMTHRVEGTQINDFQVQVDCPHCGQHHLHGLAGRPPRKELGHRHADCGKGGYEVFMQVEEDEQGRLTDLHQELAAWCEEHSVHLRIVPCPDLGGKPTIEMRSNNNPDAGTYLLTDPEEKTFP